MFTFLKFALTYFVENHLFTISFKMSSPNDLWTKLSSAEVVVDKSDGINRKLQMQKLLLDKLTEVEPGRYILRHTRVGVKSSTLRYTKCDNKDCPRKYKIKVSVAIDEIVMPYDIFVNNGICNHQVNIQGSSQVQPRPLPLKGSFRDSFIKYRLSKFQ